MLPSRPTLRRSAAAAHKFIAGQSKSAILTWLPDDSARYLSHHEDPTRTRVAPEILLWRREPTRAAAFSPPLKACFIELLDVALSDRRERPRLFAAAAHTSVAVRPAILEERSLKPVRMTPALLSFLSPSRSSERCRVLAEPDGLLGVVRLEPKGLCP